MNHFDYIISGAGCAGLSLLTRMIQSGKFHDKNILLADRDLKPRNDRTWCFWEQEAGFFEPIVFRKWSLLSFFGENFSKQFDIQPYQYKMIRGKDFFAHCLDVVSKAPNVTMVEGAIESVKSSGSGATVVVDGKKYEADYAFNSILFQKPTKGKWYFFQQHFKGWIIETSQDVFTPEHATLMDFRISQEHGTTFVYVLPFDKRRALVEYTLFTQDLLEQTAYDEALKKYVTEYITKEQYKVLEEEFGIIPMTNFPFKPADGRVINLGTAGGQTKPSSGYTFQFIQKHTGRIVSELIDKGIPPTTSISKKFSFYDSTLLGVLNSGKLEGKKIFTDLFQNGDVQTVLKFLDNETSLREDVNILKRLPKGPFTKAALREMFN